MSGLPKTEKKTDGGYFANRGFVCQSLIAVLLCLEEDGWEYIKVEPMSEQGQEDILVETSSGQSKGIQVKTSKNPFERARIKKWFDDLCSDSPGHDHSLILIGAGCKPDARKYIEDTNDRAAEDAVKNTIRWIDSAPEALEKRIKKELARYCDAAGLLLSNYNYLELQYAYEGLLGSLTDNSIKPARLSRTEFQDRFNKCLLSLRVDKLEQSDHKQRITIKTIIATLTIVCAAILLIIVNLSEIKQKIIEREGQTETEQAQSDTAIKPGYGPNRITFSMASPPDYVTLNSIVDNNQEIGHELYFASASPWSGDAKKNHWSDATQVEDGGEYVIRVYVHNNIADNPGTPAKDVRLYAVMPDWNDKAKQQTVQVKIHCANANPDAIWDGTSFYSPHGEAFSLQYVPGTAMYYNNAGAFHMEPEDSNMPYFLTSTGVSLGYEVMDGTIPPGTQYSGYFTFHVRAIFEQ